MRNETVRAVALAILLSVGTLLPLAPAATAQSAAPFICFEGEGVDGVFFEAARCGVGASEPANIAQGAALRIRVQNVEESNPYVRVRCMMDCHEATGKDFYAIWNAQARAYLTFPDDFTDPGPKGDGSNALAYRAPRYNSTWQATVLLRAGEASRDFNVWLLDVYKGENSVVRPGEFHRVIASGFNGNAPVDLVIERLGAGGQFQPVLARTGAAERDGRFRVDWYVPTDEAARIKECGVETQKCYRVRVTGIGKDNETVFFPVGPATVRFTNFVTTDTGGGIRPGEPEPVERTQMKTVAFGLNYPPGWAAQGPKLQPNDIAPSVSNPNRGLRVVIEKFNLTDRTQTVYENETWMTYVPTRFRWEAFWTIPKELPLVDGVPEPGAYYRLRLPDQSDQWGNKIPGRILGNYSVTPAKLTAILKEAPAELGRTSTGEFAWAAYYHNGSVLGVAENATAPTGCFVRETNPPRTSCPADERVTATYKNGKWVFTTTYARDYPNVNAAGQHRNLFLDGFKDKWGNTVTAGTSAIYTVIPASPEITFDTTMRGQSNTTLLRGETIGIAATIKYADGRPFNATVQVNEINTLNVTVTRRGQNGAIQSDTPIVLRESNRELGRWFASMPLARDDTESPAGTWTFTFDIADNLTVPNKNVTSFDRNIAASLLTFRSVSHPISSYQTGQTAQFVFELLYADGSRVPAEALGTDVFAHIYRYDAATRGPTGTPVSGLLQPLYEASNLRYVLKYQIPNHLFDGTYVFVLTGHDAYGNYLPENTVSRAFSTRAPTLERSVVTQPPVSVTRGDAATIVFDGRDGDVGGPGVGVPAIRLERWDTAAGGWVIERQTTRISNPDTPDHIGVFEVTTSTVIGTYRFRLEGRDINLANIQSVSQNFTIDATTVARGLTVPPPETISKGAPIAFSYERFDGDVVTGSMVLLNGRPLSMQPPAITVGRGYANVTFVIPYEAASGNYSVKINGRDLFGNVLEVISPFIEVRPTTLGGRIIGQPAEVVTRGDSVNMLFGVTNPDGGFYFSPQVPLVEVHNASGRVAVAGVERQGVTFAAKWVPPATHPTEPLWFVVGGQGTGGNAFPRLESTHFTVEAGRLTRAPVAGLAGDHTRMTRLDFFVPAETTDRNVQFTLAYYGLGSDATGIVFDTRAPNTVTPVPHTLSVTGTQYVARFETDHTTTLGAYRINMEATDAFGNTVSSRSEIFYIVPTTIVVTFDSFPDDSTFGEGRTTEFSFVARYRSGTIMTPEFGRPNVVVLLESQPIVQRPEVSFEGDRWFFRWTGPEVMPAGGYRFSVGGSDVAGNVIATGTTNDYRWNPDLGESFSKVVPGPGPIVVLLAVAVALGLARRMRR